MIPIATIAGATKRAYQTPSISATNWPRPYPRARRKKSESKIGGRKLTFQVRRKTWRFRPQTWRTRRET